MTDAPLPSIAVLGAGPVGLETALYGRFLGHQVTVVERGDVAANVLQWGHVRLFSPFQMNRSRLGIAAIQAQDPSWRCPPAEKLLTGREWVECYLAPLAATDLLADCIQSSTEVIAVGRDGPIKQDIQRRGFQDGEPFRILVRDGKGERIVQADIVVDSTGTYGHHNWLGSGGIPAVGEQENSDRIAYDLPDICGGDRSTYSGRGTLVVGSGYSAATTVVALAELAEHSPGTRVWWLTRTPLPSPGGGPMQRIKDDSLAARDELAVSANALICGGRVTHIHGVVHELRPSDSGGVEVVTSPPQSPALAVDRIVANVGYHGRRAIYEQLHVHECYASGGPIKLAAALLADDSSDCLSQSSHGAESITSPEPDFYILGAKSYGRNSSFLYSLGLQQVRDVFTIIAGRADLDLYSSIALEAPAEPT